MNDEARLALDKESTAVWPSFRDEGLGDWIIRFGGRVYGRSSSVQPYGEPGCDLTSAVIHCEDAYRTEGLAPHFRIFEIGPWSELDSFLEQRGYYVVGRTCVMTAAVPVEPVDSSVEVFHNPDPEWLGSCFALSRRGVESEPTMTALFHRMPSPRRFVRLVEQGETVAVGYGAVYAQTVWIFGMSTHVDWRRRGLASRLLGSLMAWGGEQGARRAALQVLGNNAAARALYERAGFTQQYFYHYRKLES